MGSPSSHQQRERHQPGIPQELQNTHDRGGTGYKQDMDDRNIRPPRHKNRPTKLSSETTGHTTSAHHKYCASQGTQTNNQGSNEQASVQTQITRWDIIFDKPELCTLWSTLADKWVLKAIKEQPREAKNPLTLKYATGWTTCKERIVDMMTAPDSDLALATAGSIIKEVLRSYTDADGKFRSPGHHRHTADALWGTVKVLFHESASRSFGHYEQITPNQNTTFTTKLFKWLNIITRAIRKSNNQKEIWDQGTRSGIRTTLQTFPYRKILPNDNDTQSDWVGKATLIKIELAARYKTLRLQEIRNNGLETRRKLDGWFMRDLDTYLENTIREHHCGTREVSTGPRTLKGRSP